MEWVDAPLLMTAELVGTLDGYSLRYHSSKGSGGFWRTRSMFPTDTKAIQWAEWYLSDVLRFPNTTRKEPDQPANNNNLNLS